MALLRQVAAWRRRVATEAGCQLFECTGGTQGGDGRTVFFMRPKETVEARSAEEMNDLLDRLEAALAGGSYVAGYISYEGACALLSPGLGSTDVGKRVAWFGVYDAPEVVEAGEEGAEEARQDDGVRFPLCWEMVLEPEDYKGKVRQVQAWLAEGQSYQMNLTTAVEAGFEGDVVELYEALARQQPSAYTALLHTDEGEQILSFSPELLLRLEEGGRLVTRPMKGTAAVTAGAEWLQSDEKNRAEHVMIVDLLRNDLGQVCETGSVGVDEMFAVEQYRTVLQMTSTVRGQVRAGAGLGEVLRAVLPAGSMTGAPKRRTVELLRAVEDGVRGVYSGAIGFAGPDGTAVFSVPIRTLERKGGHLRMGVGGGVVADSTPEAELAECWLKARFLTEGSQRFDIVETLQWDGERFLWLDEHMERVGHSAGRLGYGFDRARVVQEMEAFGRGLEPRTRVRVMLARDGLVRLESSELQVWSDPVAIRMADQPTWSEDTFLKYKTTYRPGYDAGLQQAHAEGFQEMLFQNERGELTEGSISSLVVRLDGQWLTPALESGLLPGVARGILLRQGAVKEAVLRVEDLERAEIVGLVNGVRGEAQVRRLRLQNGRELRWEATTEALPRY